jgi:diguanylate cyclase (GGDEF)-like protein
VKISKDGARIAWMVAAACLVAAISVIDYYSGPELTFSLFYFAVVMLVAWKSGLESVAALGAAAIAGIWLLTDWLTPGAARDWTLIWNGATRLIILVGLGLIICRLRKSLHNEQLLARTDFLTKALNARAFTEVASQEISRARRYRHPLTVAYIDVDDFKSVNDRFGHSYGDRVLSAAAMTWKANLRKTDTLSRVGGDEFIILLPETGYAQAQTVLSKLQDEVSNLHRPDDVRVTFSVGAVVFDPPPADLDTLIRAADAAMYGAKSNGKNRLRIFSGADLEKFGVDLAELGAQMAVVRDSDP